MNELTISGVIGYCKMKSNNIDLNDINNINNVTRIIVNNKNNINVEDKNNYNNMYRIIDIKKNINILNSIENRIEKNEKKVYIFFDDHSNKKYCKNKSSLFIDKMFDIINTMDKNNDIAFLVEEPFIYSDTELITLWNDSLHVTRFRSFYQKIKQSCAMDSHECRMFPIDIRLCLTDVSIDELYEDPENKKYRKTITDTSFNYFKYVYNLFNIINIESPEDKTYIFIKKLFDKFQNSILYKSLKMRIEKFREKFVLKHENHELYNLLYDGVDTTFIYCPEYPIKNSNENDFRDQFDKILNGIMELYTLILIISLPSKNIIVYCGYFHANNLMNLLETTYNYKVMNKVGITEDINTLDKSIVNNCIKIPIHQDL